MSKSASLSELEMVLMGVLWDKGEPLTIVEITALLEEERHLSTASVTQAVNRLLKKGVVQVSGFVPAVNVYARNFAPTVTREEFVESELKRIEEKISPNSRLHFASILASFLKNDTDCEITEQELDEIQELIDQRRNQ